MHDDYFYDDDKTLQKALLYAVRLASFLLPSFVRTRKSSILSTDDINESKGTRQRARELNSDK